MKNTTLKSIIFFVQAVLISSAWFKERGTYRMWFLFIISMSLIFQFTLSQTCETANWWASLDKKGWSVCPKTNTYLKGFWRNDPSGSNGVWLLEEGKCCAASEPSYTNKPATCRNEKLVEYTGWVSCYNTLSMLRGKNILRTTFEPLLHYAGNCRGENYYIL